MYFSLHKIVFHFKASLWKSIILSSPPPPTCKAFPIAVLLHDYCAIYAPPPTPPFYAKHHILLAMAMSWKSQFVLRNLVVAALLLLQFAARVVDEEDVATAAEFVCVCVCVCV